MRSRRAAGIGFCREYRTNWSRRSCGSEKTTAATVSVKQKYQRAVRVKSTELVCSSQIFASVFMDASQQPLSEPLEECR